MPPDPAAMLAALIDMIAVGVAAKLGAAPGQGEASRYYSADDNPLGGRRAFLDAVKRDAFPAFRAGKRVLARREDVHRWIEAHPARRPTAHPASNDTAEPTDEELLAASGVRLLPAPGPHGGRVDHVARPRRASRAQ